MTGRLIFALARFEAAFFLVVLTISVFPDASASAQSADASSEETQLLLLDPELARAAVRAAVENGRPETIVRIVRAIRRSRNGTWVVDRDRERHHGMLLELLLYPDVRVQFAAADAAMHLLPDTRIPSGYRLVRTLAQMVSADPAPTALVIDGDPSRANESTAIFQQMGYMPLVASTGRSGFRIAAREPVDFIVIEASCGNWSARDTVANLKADQRTAGVPVLLYGTNRHWWRPADQAWLRNYLGRITTAHSRVVTPWRDPLPGMGHGVYVVPRPMTIEDWYRMTEPVLAREQSRPLKPEERAAYRHAALHWMLRIARNDFPRSGLRIREEDQPPVRRMLYDFDLVILAADVLAHLPSQTNQEELAAAVLNDTLAPVARIASARALGTGIGRGSFALHRRTFSQLLQLYRSTGDDDLKTELAGVIGVSRTD
ncbi:hypothetical protein GC176_25480 [bacterium]|nr:hypothetical protein [bacterium]